MLVVFSNPRGVTGNQMVSMAVSIHADWIDEMSKDFMDLSHYTWANHLNFRVLRIHPTFVLDTATSTSEYASTSNQSDSLLSYIAFTTAARSDD